MNRIRHELELFFTALRVFTRLPVPGWVGHSTELLNHSARWFPAVGLIVGLAGAAVLWTTGQVLP
ncbi:MAG TPA: adenosylcobinamide-GDP ribazoletransferase, partial [Methyloversatilis sp.]